MVRQAVILELLRDQPQGLTGSQMASMLGIETYWERSAFRTSCSARCRTLYNQGILERIPIGQEIYWKIASQSEGMGPSEGAIV